MVSDLGLSQDTKLLDVNAKPAGQWWQTVSRMWLFLTLVRLGVADSIRGQQSPHVERTFAERPAISAHGKTECAECFHFQVKHTELPRR